MDAHEQAEWDYLEINEGNEILKSWFLKGSANPHDGDPYRIDFVTSDGKYVILNCIQLKVVSTQFDTLEQAKVHYLLLL